VIRSASRFRAVIVSLAVLALTAGVALAARPALTPPAAASASLERAADAAGKVVPVAHPAEHVDRPAENADEDADEPAKDASTAEPADAPAAEADATVHPDNHGKAVSEAAKAATPTAFSNNGQYVKTVATDNHGQETAAEHAPAPADKVKPTH
jgi:hypothetical protein